MKLERLDIRVLAGLEDSFSVSFAPDAVNFITGPNASGKSSIIRAVRALLYPEQTPDFCHVRGRWRIGEKLLECERHGTAVTWLDGAMPAPPPQLPGSESLGAYLISSEDLVELGSTESHIAAQIRTMLAGGYDLDAVVSQPPLATPPKPQKRSREFADLRRKLRDKEDEYARLNDELETLSELERELETVTNAANRLRACEDALALAEAIARRTAIEHTLIDEFPGGMDRLRGDELSRLDQLDEQLADRRKEKQLTAKALEEAEQRLEQTGAVDPHEIEVLQAELSELRDNLSDLERRIEEHRGELEQAQSDEASAARLLGGQKSELDSELDQDQLEQLEKLVERVMTQREKIRTLSGELVRSHVPHTDVLHPPEKLRQARQALNDWLEYCRLTGLEGLLWGGLTATAGLAAWRVLGPRELDAVPELILLILLATGIPLALLIKFIDRYRTLGRSRAAFSRSGVDEPMGWNESEVEARLERLDQELEAATRQSVQQARAGEVRERLNSERTALEQARERLDRHARALGLSSDNRIETGFLLWCRHLHDWQQASRRAEHHQHRLDECRRQHRALVEEAVSLGKRHGLDMNGELSSRDLSSLIHQLTPRMRANAELHNEIRAHRRRLEELDADIEQLEKQHDQLFEQAGLRVGDRETLTQRIELFEQWRTLEQQRRDRSVEVNRLEHKLGDDETELLKLARDKHLEALERLRDELGEQAARRDELNRHIATIHTRRDEVLKRRELETMTGEFENRRQELTEALDAHLMSAAGQTLIADVRSAHQADNEPAALSRATRWFEQFTHHRYRLIFSDQRFEAFDNRAERSRPISELSTATRAQLLLALRLAWIEQAEQNREPLPVFMDEVLTTSDPDRYQHVVEAVQEIVAGGRQMFYLTAQGDEVAAWSDRAGEGPAPHHIDMAEVRKGQIEPLELAMPREETRRRDIPDPEDATPEQWAGNIGVAPINPWQGSGMISVFHLLHDDLELAARLMRAELGHLGELTVYLESGAADDDLLAESERTRLRRRSNAVALILDDWRHRHDRPVDAAALHAFGLITDTFMPRVMELVDQVAGAPREVLSRLREGQVARFRSDITDQLEQWLIDNHYLSLHDSQPPISAAELAARTGLEIEEAGRLREWIVSAIDDPLAEPETSTAR